MKTTIGVIGAMTEEVTLLREKLDIVSTKNILGLDFYVGKLSGHSVVLVRSGIGKVNAALCVQILVDMFGVDCVINTGVAGAISKQINIGDVVVSDDLVQHDFDVTTGGTYKQGEIPGMGFVSFAADDTLKTLAVDVGREILKHETHLGRIATGDQFIASMSDKQRIWDNFRAFCVEMEGAAIAQACYLNQIPFVVIRSISDKADESADMSFDKFLTIAARNSSDVVETMISRIE